MATTLQTTHRLTTWHRTSDTQQYYGAGEHFIAANSDGWNAYVSGRLVGTMGTAGEARSLVERHAGISA